MTQPRFQTAKEARAAGWFSRRHETNAAHLAAREWWHLNKSKEARRHKAGERAS